jgi:hypothetical protein
MTEPDNSPVSSTTCKQKRNILTAVFGSLLLFPGRGGGPAYSILDRNCTIASECYGRRLPLTRLFERGYLLSTRTSITVQCRKVRALQGIWNPNMVGSKLLTQRMKVNQVIRLFSRLRLPQSIRLPCPARTSACQDDWPCHQHVCATCASACMKVKVVS